MSNELSPILQNLSNEIQAAATRIEPIIRRTYLQRSLFLSELTGANVFLKCENLQKTGSFKLRGAANKILSMPVSQRSRVVAASTGNHGKAVAYVANELNLKCTIFSPENARPSKLDAIRWLGAEVVLAGDDCVQAEESAREFANVHSIPYLSPYNDPLVVAGQGTIGLEICEQLDSVDAVFASVGGGGMIAGLATAIKSRFPDCKVVASSPANSCVMIQSLERGRLMDFPSEDTFSDGTAGGIEADSITFELCQNLIDQSVLVSEFEIAKTLAKFLQTEGMLIEGAAAVPIVALLNNKQEYQGQNVVVVLCGANIGNHSLAQILKT